MSISEQTYSDSAPWPVSRRALWGLCMVLSLGLAVVSHLTTRGESLVPETLGFAAANSLWVATTIPPGPFRTNRILALTLGLITVIGVGVNLAFGLSVIDTARLALGNAVFPLLLLGLRTMLQPDLRTWAVESVQDLICLLTATVCASLAILPIGISPEIYLGGDAQVRELLWWSMRNVDFVFIALACVPVLWRADVFKILMRDRSDLLLAIVLYVAAAGAMWVIFNHPGYALTFLPLLPMIAAGMALRVISCTVTTGLIGLTAAAFCSMPKYSFSYESLLPMPIALDILVACCALTSLYLALTREQRDIYSVALEQQSAAMETTNQLLKSVQDGMDEGIIVFTPEGEAQIHNRAALELLGLDSDEDIAGDWLEHSQARTIDGAPLPQAFRKLRPGREDQGVVTIRIGRGQQDRILEFHISALNPSAPDPSMLVLLRDITLEHHRIEDLRNFAASAAHDLKAPLTGLRGWIELAGSEVASLHHNRNAMAALNRADRSARAMSRIIDDWLAYSLERRGTLQTQTLSLTEVLGDLLPTFSYDAGSGLPQFTVAAEDSVNGDESLIRQLLANLISNSCKYTRPGEPPDITITSRPVDDGWIQVEVGDQGPGIPENDMSRIFEPFQRGSGPNLTRAKGTGLGLALCERIVHRHKGTIHARPNTPHGVVVSFTLPRGPVSTPSDLAAKSAI